MHLKILVNALESVLLVGNANCTVLAIGTVHWVELVPAAACQRIRLKKSSYRNPFFLSLQDIPTASAGNVVVGGEGGRY